MKWQLGNWRQGRLRAICFAVICFVVIALGWQVQAQIDDLNEVTVEGKSSAVSAPEASSAIKQTVQTSVARQAVIDLIGEKAYQKSKSLIESRIIRESYKFIPFVTPGTPVKTGNVWTMPVTLKVSKRSLRQMIIDNGLLFDVEGPAALLPMVAIHDKIKGLRYQWWTSEKEEAEKKFLIQLNQSLHQALFNEMVGRGFYVLRPFSPILAQAVPESFFSDRARPEDLQFVGDFFGAQMLVRGDIRLRESTEISGGYQISVKMQAAQTANGRSVAEVARTYETEAGSFEPVIRTRLQTVLPELSKDLAVQVTDAWQKGTLGSNLVRLSLRGRLSPKQVSDFKNSLMKSVREIKSVRERVIEPEGITFEVDYSGEVGSFADRFKSVSIPGFAVRTANASETGVVLDVRAQ